MKHGIKSKLKKSCEKDNKADYWIERLAKIVKLLTAAIGLLKELWSFFSSHYKLPAVYKAVYINEK